MELGEMVFQVFSPLTRVHEVGGRYIVVLAHILVYPFHKDQRRNHLRGKLEDY